MMVGSPRDDSWICLNDLVDMVARVDLEDELPLPKDWGARWRKAIDVVRMKSGIDPHSAEAVIGDCLDHLFAARREFGLKGSLWDRAVTGLLSHLLYRESGFTAQVDAWSRRFAVRTPPEFESANSAWTTAWRRWLNGVEEA